MKYLSDNEIFATLGDGVYKVQLGNLSLKNDGWLLMNVYISSSWFDVISKCEISEATFKTLTNDLNLLSNFQKQEVELATEYGSFLLRFELTKTGICNVSGKISESLQSDEMLIFRFSTYISSISNFVRELKKILNKNNTNA